MNYIIPKYFHYSNFIPSIICKKTSISYHKTFKFNESAIYDIEEKSCVNKLMGLCYGFLNIHTESDRFGWTYNNETEKINIFTYSYNKGKLYKENIYELELNENVEFDIYVSFSKNVRSVNFCINNETVANKIYHSENIYSDYIVTLGPYFGGNTRAPHTITIES